MSGARVLSQVDYSISISGARYAVTSAQKSKAYNVYIYYLLFIYQHNNCASTIYLTRCLHGPCSESDSLWTTFSAGHANVNRLAAVTTLMAMTGDVLLPCSDFTPLYSERRDEVDEDRTRPKPHSPTR